MKKSDAIPVVRQLFDKWLEKIPVEERWSNNFLGSDFYSWVRENHVDYTKFRSRMGARYDVEHEADKLLREWRVANALEHAHLARGVKP